MVCIQNNAPCALRHCPSFRFAVFASVAAGQAACLTEMFLTVRALADDRSFAVGVGHRSATLSAAGAPVKKHRSFGDFTGQALDASDALVPCRRANFDDGAFVEFSDMDALVTAFEGGCG